jgi:hypothetical protein
LDDAQKIVEAGGLPNANLYNKINSLGEKMLPPLKRNGHMQSWITKQLEREDCPLLLRYPRALDPTLFQPRFPFLVALTHQFSKVSTNGLPDPDYNASLLGFDRDFRAAFDTTRRGIAVLIETFGGRRNHYIYARTDPDISQIVCQISTTHPQEKLSWSVYPDPHESFFEKYSKKFLRPA